MAGILQDYSLNVAQLEIIFYSECIGILLNHALFVLTYVCVQCSEILLKYGMFDK